ncbi:DNA repair protein XRCC3 isoform X2 [Tribolium castaneum]|uniref:Spindle B n=1 Tax=Tribolium castaneum TaxID=7070 RepID=D6WL17_TRICA|nr:PREDICTED: DNA repair protein XRCC3 isoform X2 [Tribolium castaneum]EFA04612.2 spindle B [Tribolium castaneum]|eukprot:XP_008193679.1 PREDICTED: DNA repair protein XRCC3 isoform X2 [Tribolium castaneum]
MEKLKEKIAPDVYENLLKANIASPSAIFSHTKTELMQMTDLDSNCVEEVLKESANIVLSGKIGTAHQMPKWHRISTGCSAIDAITRGGIAVNRISEIVGYAGVGKTQLCLQLSLMAQLPISLGGLGKSVVYLCTEDAFPIKRLKDLAITYSLKYHDLGINFEDNIFIEHLADVEQLKKCLSNSLTKLLLVKNVGLVVIDSIAGIFRSETLDVNYKNRNQDFILIVTLLNKLAKKYGFAVVCVNQVTDNPTTNVTEPCLGLAWSNCLTYRFNINRFVNTKVREFEVVFAPDLSNQTCKFTITGEGLRPVA